MVLQDRGRGRKILFKGKFYLFCFVILCTVVFMVIFYSPQRFPPSKEVTGWEVGVVRDTRIYVVPNNDTTLLGKTNICTPKTTICIIVTSAPSHFDARNAIRKTWAYNLPQYVTIAFLLGLNNNTTLQSQIEEESERHKDIILEDFIDSYNNLTVKSILMLKWYNTKCIDSHKQDRAKFLVKCDDDMYLNVSAIHNLVSGLNKTSGVLIGSLIQNARPILDHRSKWYSPRYMFNKNRYPDYVSGTSYLMSSDVATKLYNVALYTPLFHLEDVYITGICASIAGVKRQNNWKFTYSKAEKSELGCKKDMVSYHGFTPKQLLTAWANRHTCNKPQPSKTTVTT